MTLVMYDAINPENIPDSAAAVAGYDDGLYAWSQGGWARFANVPHVHISVFADEASLAFDVEGGNASARTVAGVVAGRTSAGNPSWVYFYQEEMPTVLAAFQAASVPFLDRSEWPRPGAYIWAADPSGNIASGAWRLPVDPVAVQTTNTTGYDVSTVYVDLSMLIEGQPNNPPIDLFGGPMQIATNSQGQLVIAGSARDNGNLLVFTETVAGQWTVADVTDAIHGANPADTRNYSID